MSQDNIKDLEDMFRAVLNTSTNLENSYNELKDKFELLQIKLENNRKYLENILKSIKTGVCSIDLQGRITTFNKEASLIFNIDEEAVKGKHYSDIFRVDEFENFNVFDLINSKKRKLSIIGIDKRIRKLDISVSSIEDNKKVVGAVIIFSDITEMEELREENRKKETLATIGQMATSIAHDIKNPLASIELFVPLLIGDDESKKELSDNIMISIKRINNIINNTLLFTKTVILKPENFSSVDFARDIELEIYAHTHSSDVAFIKSIDDFSITTDKNLLKSAVVNLIVNALDAAKKKVEFKVYRLNKNAVFEIKDDGEGIDKKDIEHIFEPFYTKKKNGTGLGLSIVSKAVNLLNGKLDLESSEKGTVCRVVL